MGRIVDMVTTKMNLLRSEPMKIIDRNFMLGLLDELRQELPPLQEHYECFYNKKNQYKVVREKNKVSTKSRIIR